MEPPRVASGEQLAELGAITAALVGPALAGQAPLARTRSAIEAVIIAYVTGQVLALSITLIVLRPYLREAAEGWLAVSHEDGIARNAPGNAA